ncbi:flagellar hook-associated protein FlgK [Phenylobacterium sp.]|jgi:flagellar hook-associated protein 1 FlgK|uniref:flagellar hook-associated protein FlgK n=1 Tax=Phenylobacterium sp. TaxID=1871053 RepID=UPI002F92A96C
MSLTVTLKTATSGLLAAQTGMRAISDNISNVNTAGYTRKTVDQRPVVVNGTGMGVEVTGIKRVTDQYLQLASLTASSESARWDVFSQYLDNAQALFGDPSSEGFFFNRLDAAYGAFAASADDPSSTLLRNQALGYVEDFLSETGRINTQIKELAKTVDVRVSADIERANALLAQINTLNSDISRALLIEQDSSGSENIQAGLIDELSAMMSVQVIPRPQGGVTIRSAEGVKLSGDGSATLSYERTDSTKGYILATPAGGLGSPQAIQINAGGIRGMLDLRNTELPALSDQLGEFVSRAVDKLNAAHNAATPVPAPQTLTGRDTGLDIATALGGFTGTTTVTVQSASGNLQRTVAINFDTGSLSVNAGAPVLFTPATFVTVLTTALGPGGSATFNANGALSIGTAAGNGIAIDEGTSMKAGRAFSHYFGLNDLVKAQGYTTYETGLTSASNHGFTAGQTIQFAIAQGDGRPVRNVTVTVPAGATMASLLAELNGTTTGVGLFGQFALAANGVLKYTPTQPADGTISVVQDTTSRGVGGPSMSQLFGLGVLERNARANRFSVNSTLVNDPTKLALGKVDATVGIGALSIRPGDGRGALAISNAGDVDTTFQPAGSLGQVTMTVARYAAEFGGSIGREANAAEMRKTSADAVRTEATARRQAVEGVNLDEELVRLTSYQQAFNASARMIQAASDLFEVLVKMV